MAKQNIGSSGVSVNDIVRIDRNLVNFSEVFSQNYQDDANLVMSLLGFILGQLRNNLFNYATFTISDFCKKYNYRKEHLTKIYPLFKELSDAEVKKPRKGEIRPYIDKANGHVYRNVIDHVLFRMLKENVVFSPDIAEDKLKHISNQRSIQLLKRLSIKNKNTRKGAQGYVYEVTLGDELFNNLFRYYISFQENKFIALGKGKSGINKRSLYFYLLQQYNRCLASKMPITLVTPNFFYLCRVAGLNNTKVRNNKQTLIKYLDILGEEDFLNFKHNLKKIDLDDPNFRIEIEFQKLMHFESYKVKNFLNDLVKTLNDYFLSNHYETLTAADLDEDFFDKFQLWLNDHERHLEHKSMLVKQVYQKTFGKEISLDIARSTIIKNSWTTLIVE